MSVRISSSFQDRRRALLGERRKKMAAPRRLDRIDGDLDIAVGAVLDSHRHRQTRGQFPMHLALRCAGADGTPADEVCIELAESGIEKLGPGADAEFDNIGKQLPSEAQSFIDSIRLIYIGLVDQYFPADDSARFFEVYAHDNQKRARKRIDNRLELGRVFEGSLGVVYRARADHDEKPAILAVEDRLDGTARSVNVFRRRFGERNLLSENRRR